jgi:hypothetical protein
MKDVAAQRADELHTTIYELVDARIKAAFVIKWREGLSGFQKLFTNTKTHERLLRTRMGLPDTGGLPDPFVPTKEPPTDSTAPAAGGTAAQSGAGQQAPAAGTMPSSNAAG